MEVFAEKVEECVKMFFFATFRESKEERENKNRGTEEG